MIVLCLSTWSLAGCGSSSQPSASACDPNSAPEVLAVTVQNAGQEHLQSYAVAIPLDATTFDFTIPAPDSSDLAAWDESSNQPLPHWLESYDPAGQKKGLLWVKIPDLGPQSSRRFLLTGGSAQGCSIAAGSGYSVFPFFSDVNDVLNWRAPDQLSVTGDAAVGPSTVTRRSVIQSDGTYNGFPGIVQAANGDFVLSYTKGSSHVSGPFVVARRSQDGGMSWSPEAVFFNTSIPDPVLARSPQGALLVGLGKLDQNGDEGGAYSRSTDNGLTWGPFTFFDQPVSDSIIVAPLLNVGQTMYAAGYGPFAGGMGDTPSLWSSVDDGLSWTKLSQLRGPEDPGLNETAIAQTGPNSLFAVMRTDDGLDTFGRYSDDTGLTWGPLLSYTTQVGVLQAPQLIQAGSALLLLGRENIAIPGVQPANTLGFPRQLVGFVSYDGGQSFGYGTVLDTYTGQQIDGGYSSSIVLANGDVYVAYYADSHNLRQPDIKSLVLSVTPPSTQPAGSIHVLSQLAPRLATHTVDLGTWRYALEFRFRSNPTPAGSQFSVVLQGLASGAPSNLVNWELPSTHATDPTSISGIISGGQFVPILDFSYGQSYRLRTVVDEPLGTQQVSVLDDFGAVSSTTASQSLAQGSGHVTAIQIGNNSSLRATDSLLDFIFLRPAAQVEPQVIVMRTH